MYQTCTPRDWPKFGGLTQPEAFAAAQKVTDAAEYMEAVSMYLMYYSYDELSVKIAAILPIYQTKGIQITSRSIISMWL